MISPYDVVGNLARLADEIRVKKTPGLPALFVMTDPERTQDPITLANTLHADTALVYRHFGARNRYKIGEALAKIAQIRKFSLFVSSDSDLADAIGADGIHWPEKDLSKAASRRACGDKRPFTIAAHSPLAILKAQKARLNGVFYSCVFPSKSPSASNARGLFSASCVTRQTTIPVYALGGINLISGRRLKGLGFGGIACVGAVNPLD